MEEYSDKDLLVEVTWLVSNISDPNIVVIDCDSGDAYSRGHIPGSVHLPTHMYVKSAKDKLFVMDDEEFSAMCSNLGIDNETLVITYDNSQSLYATRLWWVFDYYGHDKVRVLNGGWREWVNQGNKCSFERPNIRDNKKFVTGSKLNRYASKDDVIQACSMESSQIWDVRSDGEFEGTETRNNARSGHVPGAVHLEWFNLMDRQTHLFRSEEDIKAILAENGIALDKAIYTY